MDREKAVTTRATNGHRVFLRAARTGGGGGAGNGPRVDGLNRTGKRLTPALE